MGGHVAALEVLLAYGAVVNRQEDDGRTPLHWAVLGGHVPVVALLLAAGADVTKPDANFATPLHAASSAPVGNRVPVTMLLEAGADVDALDAWGQSPIHAAILGAAEGDEGNIERTAVLDHLLGRGAALDR